MAQEEPALNVVAPKSFGRSRPPFARTDHRLAHTHTVTFRDVWVYSVTRRAAAPSEGKGEEINHREAGAQP